MLFSIAVRDIYTCPTIDGLAKIVETKEDERRKQKSSPSVGKKRVFNSNHMDFTQHHASIAQRRCVCGFAICLLPSVLTWITTIVAGQNRSKRRFSY
jgi:hypothetical protein